MRRQGLMHSGPNGPVRAKGRVDQVEQEAICFGGELQLQFKYKPGVSRVSSLMAWLDGWLPAICPNQHQPTFTPHRSNSTCRSCEEQGWGGFVQDRPGP
jgi:hypothetical protein